MMKSAMFGLPQILLEDLSLLCLPSMSEFLPGSV